MIYCARTQPIQNLLPKLKKCVPNSPGSRRSYIHQTILRLVALLNRHNCRAAATQKYMNLQKKKNI